MEIIILTLIFSFIIFSLNRDININDTIATLGLFGIVGLRLLPAFSRIIVSFQSLKFRSASFKILYEELNKKIDNNEIKSYQNRNIKNDLFSEKINFKNISFKYGEKKYLKILI